MDRGDILSGAAFTAVLRSAIVFLVILITVGWATLAYIENNLMAQFRLEVRERWELLAADHQAEGLDSVINTISSCAPAL